MMQRDEVRAIVYKTITGILPVPVEKISGEQHIKDLGADSVDRVEIILSLIDQMKIREPLASFAEIRNIDGLVDFLYERTR
jgi:polyketide biosynthesis acyl carrier protein